MSHSLPSRTVSNLDSQEIHAFMAPKYMSLCLQNPVIEEPLESNNFILPTMPVLPQQSLHFMFFEQYIVCICHFFQHTS
jgi:hypothetical protein